MQLDLSNIKTSQDAKAAGLPVFKVLSDSDKPIKAYKDEKGVRRFTLTASSDATDLAGDCFSSKALDRMQQTAEGMTMFLNHSYNVPGDVFGAVEKSTLERKKVFNRALNKDVEYLCLTYDGKVTEINPAAVQTHDMMLEGIVTLGGSVSVLITEKSNAKDGRRMIDDVLNLECSIVGLPCNPTSWVESASKALKTAAVTAPLTTDEPAPTTASESAPTIKPGVSAPNSSRTEENPMSYKFVIASKGMFNDELKKQESSLWHLVDVFMDAVWNLYFQVEYYNNKDIDPTAELGEICDEFKAAMMERYLPKLLEETEESKSLDAADKAMSQIAKAASIARLITGESDLTKKAMFVSKEGKRNSGTDQKMLDEIHKLTVGLGAACEKSVTATDDAATDEGNKAAPGADKTASQAPGNAQPNPLEAKVASLEVEKKSLEEMAQKAVEAAENLASERDAAVKLAELSMHVIESYGLQPLS